jgi:hypothetical protein
MPPYLNSTVNLSAIRFDWHNLFAFSGFGHLHLLSGQVAQAFRMLHALKLVFMATYEASRRATITYDATVRANCQYLCGRIGIWASSSKEHPQGFPLAKNYTSGVGGGWCR